MGANKSRPLAEISKEDVAAHLSNLGPEFKIYASLADDNGIDGDLLSEMDEQIFLETLDDVDIHNQSHRTRLLEEFKFCSSAFTIEVMQPPQGPINEVSVSAVKFPAQRDYPSPLAVGLQGRDSSQMPSFSLDHSDRATEAEQRHLSPGFYKKIDSIPEATRPPISKEDMERVAQVEAYALQEIEPDSDIAAKLLSLIEMAGVNMFEFDLADITFLNNECQYSLTRVGLTEPLEEAILGNVYEAINYSKDGKPFLCKTDRSIGICNYPTYSGRTFVVHDILEDIAFRWMRLVWPFRCYVGAPLLTANGLVIGTLCLHSLDPRPDFDSDCEVQLEQVANMIVQSIENWKLRRNITVLESTRLSLQSTKNKTKPPQDKGVACYVGVEEYETMLDVAPAQMKDAMKIYRDIVQKLRQKYFGYEVAKNGQDRYFIMFHDAVDSFGFALDLQQSLFDAEWTDEFMALPRVGDNGTGFRGLRVKVGAFMGDVTAVKSLKTGKTEYQSMKSHVIGIAKTLYGMSFGGQILTCFGTWNVASFLADTKLSSPQVVDLGEHVIRTGKNASDGVISERIVQLVPASLAIDFGEVATNTEKNNESATSIGDSMDLSIGDDLGRCPGLWGRQFPNIRSEKQLSPSFFDAPGLSDSGIPAVTIAFIGTNEIEKRYKEATEIVSRIIGLASLALRGTKGYQCQNNMLAFPNLKAAADFGLNFSTELKKQDPLEDGENVGSLVTYGCVHDSFTSLEPHKTTGRADYFGKVVNRAARVAYTSALGFVFGCFLDFCVCTVLSFSLFLSRVSGLFVLGLP